MLLILFHANILPKVKIFLTAYLCRFFSDIALIYFATLNLVEEKLFETLCVEVLLIHKTAIDFDG